MFNNQVKDFNFIKLDLALKKNNLVNIVKKLKPNYIFDFASVCLVNESWEKPNYYFNVNYLSKIDFVKHLYKYNFLKSYIM